MESIVRRCYEAILLFISEVCFEFIEFFSCTASSFVLCSLPSIVSVYGTINDLSRVFFSFSSSLKKYTSLCKVSTCDLSEDIASYAMLLVSYVSFYVYNFHVPLRPLS